MAVKSTETRYREIITSQILPSPQNPRGMVKADDDLTSLAQNIGEIGLISPILVRPDADGYEIIAGHRRFAAWEYGQEHLGFPPEIPCLVQEDLTDAEAHLRMAAENLQREDLPPLAQAQAIANLVNKGLELEVIGRELGKGAAWVGTRARLAELSKTWKDALEAEPGLWPIGHLVEIARLPHKLQDDVHEDLEFMSDDIQVPTLAELRLKIADLVRALKNAPWDLEDQNLVNLRPACSNCPENTGTVPTLFPEEGDASAGRCMNAECYASKLEAFLKTEIAAKKKEIPGIKMIYQAPGDHSAGILDRGSKVMKGGENAWMYSKVGPKAKGATPALVMDGVYAGQVIHIKKEHSGATTGEGPSLHEAKRRLEQKRKSEFFRMARELANDLLISHHASIDEKELSSALEERYLKAAVAVGIKPFDYAGAKKFDKLLGDRSLGYMKDFAKLVMDSLIAQAQTDTSQWSSSVEDINMLLKFCGSSPDEIKAMKKEAWATYTLDAKTGRVTKVAKAKAKSEPTTPKPKTKKRRSNVKK